MDNEIGASSGRESIDENRASSTTELARDGVPARRQGPTSAILRRNANTKTIAVRVCQVNLTTPRLILDLGAEFGGDRLDLAHVEVDESAGNGIAGVLREEDSGSTSARH